MPSRGCRCAGSIALRAVLVAGIVCGASGTAGADPDARAAALRSHGRHLARECTGCHRPDAGRDGIPAIAGRPQAEILAALSDYREGRKTNPVMVSVAKSLDAEQTAAVAAYFSSLPRSATATDDPVHWCDRGNLFLAHRVCTPERAPPGCILRKASCRGKGAQPAASIG